MDWQREAALLSDRESNRAIAREGYAPDHESEVELIRRVDGFGTEAFLLPRSVSSCEAPDS